MATKYTVTSTSFLWRITGGDTVESKERITGVEGRIGRNTEVEKTGRSVKETLSDGTETIWVEVRQGLKIGFLKESELVEIKEGDPVIGGVPAERALEAFVGDCIAVSIAKRTNAAYLLALAWVESGSAWEPDKVRNPAGVPGKALGVYQILPKDWAAFVAEHGEAEGIADEDILSPLSQCVYAGVNSAESAAALQSSLERPVNTLDLYLAHLFGPGKAELVYAADKADHRLSTLLEEIFGDDEDARKEFSERKAELLKWDGDGSLPVKKLVERCVTILSAGYDKVVEVAASLAPAVPESAEDGLGGLGSSTPSAERILAVAERFLGRPYKNIRVDYANPNWTGAFDCAEYATYCTYQTFGRLYGTTNNNDIAKADAYTGRWQIDSRPENLGHRISVDEALSTPGAFVLRFPPEPGKMGHIGICIGDGKHIFEARGTQHGVGKFSALGRNWNTGVKLPFTGYGLEREASRLDLVFKEAGPLAIASDTVRQIEQALVTAGFLAQAAVDGIFDATTTKAVELFQKHESLVEDGEVGPITGEKLLGAAVWTALQVAADKYQVPSSADYNLLTLARTIYGEARGEPKKGKEAVGLVVLNRLTDKRFPLYSTSPETVAGICLDPWQFSCWNHGDPNRPKIASLPANSPDPDFVKCLAAARDVLLDRVPDHTMGATHYFKKTIATPSWVTNSPKAKLTITIGDHKFYRGIA